MPGGHSHQAGGLKQSNKKHKGLASKRARKASFGPGKVQSLKGESGGSKAQPRKGDNIQDGRLNRLNRNQQIKKQKQSDLIAKKRALGAAHGPPKIVGVLCLSQLASSLEAMDMLTSESSWSAMDQAGKNMVHASYQKHKTRCTFITAQCDNITETLDLAKVVDLLVIVVKIPSHGLDETGIIDGSGYSAISALKAAGCPEVLCCLQGMDMLDGKALVDSKKAMCRHLQEQFGPDVKIGEAHKADLFCRQMCTMTVRNVNWRLHRSFLLADNVEVDRSETECVVTVGGFLRGNMALNSLVHVAGMGTGRIRKVRAGTGPFPESHKEAVEMASADDDGFIHADESKQDPINCEAEGSGISGEQTWPTEAEMDAALGTMDEGAGRHRRNVPAKVPEGMSSYQADWFMDEQGVFDEDEKKIAEKDAKRLEAAGGGATMEEQPFEDEGGDDDDFSMGGSMLDGPYIGGSGQAEKQRLRALADSDAQFPDEMDTPIDQKARERFARFRAMQSFRSSQWHPKENLPGDYSRIYQFENFSGVQKNIATEAQSIEDAVNTDNIVVNEDLPFCFKVDKEGKEEEVDMNENEKNEEDEVYLRGGQYVYIEIVGLSPDALESFSQKGYQFIFGLHRHENRLSVLHFTVKRHPGYAEMIKSKENLIFQTGFRSFECKPIFSESNLNCDKHKMERFLLDDRFSMASVYGPITFMNCPLLVFKKLDNGQKILVATGTLSKIDPDRIMLKKVILTGLPIRVRKRFAVVKHLFYDTQDVRWFKPAELVTKHGLRGHIKEPVGTHGLLKALFSAPITQNDTVMLILYKRVYPKFPEGGVILK